MKLRYLTSAIAIAAVTAGAAQAFEFTGGNADVSVYYYPDYGVVGYVVSGAAVADLGNGWGLQFDAASYGWDDNLLMPYAVALHVFNDVSPEWTLGAFAAYEDWQGDPYGNAGVQAVMMNGPWSVEALVAAEWYLDNASTPYFFGSVGGSYTLGNGVTLYASLPFEEDGTTYPNAGARYGFGNGMYVAGGVGAYIYPGNPADLNVQVRIGKDFGTGAKLAKGFWPTILTGY